MLRTLLIIFLLSAICGTGCSSVDLGRIQSDAIDYYVDGDLESYKKDIRDAYERDPDDPYAMNNMGVLYELEGDIKKAKEMYSKAIDHAGERTVRKSSREGDKDKYLKDIAEENLDRVERFKAIP